MPIELEVMPKVYCLTCSTKTPCRWMWVCSLNDWDHWDFCWSFGQCYQYSGMYSGYLLLFFVICLQFRIWHRCIWLSELMFCALFASEAGKVTMWAFCSGQRALPHQMGCCLMYKEDKELGRQTESHLLQIVRDCWCWLVLSSGDGMA